MINRILGLWSAAKTGRHSIKTVKKPALSLCAAALFMSMSPAQATAGQARAFLVPQKAIHAPAGFSGLCQKYSWVCQKTRGGALTASATLKLANDINRQVNRQIRQIEDIKQYGREEYWALPTQRGGDCEDLVLLKKKMLIEQGVPSHQLLISTVLDKKLNSHAVLVLRTSAGDVVLDNLTNRILPWNKTGYTFLKLQNPKSLSRWDAVLAGGVINDRPTASR